MNLTNLTENNQIHENRPKYRLFGQTFASEYPFGNRFIPSDDSTNFIFTCSDIQPPFSQWKDTEPTYISPYRNRDGKSVLTFYDMEGYQLMRYPDIADFYLWDQRIYCHLLNPANGELATLHIFPSVVSTWMELRKGVIALHASAVVVEDATVAFLAHSGHGKSTLAATFVKAGYPLLTDDILLIEASDRGFQTQPGYPSMRLWPNEAIYFRGQYEDLEIIKAGYEKRRLPLDDQMLLGFCDRATPLGCIFLPHRRSADDDNGDVQIAPVSNVEAVIELIRYAYTTRLSRALKRDSHRLTFFSQLATNIPILRLSYPSGHECLPDVLAEVIEELS